MKWYNLVWFFLIAMLAACHPTSRDARQTARDALENARIQLDSGNKADAMRLFKEAEHYGLLADDTLTVAHARLNIAQCLGYYADKEEVVSLLKSAAEGFGEDYADRADALRELGDFYQFHRAYDTAEMVLQQAWAYAEQSGSLEAKRTVSSAFHAMYFNAGEYEKSGDYLRRFLQLSMPDVDDRTMMYYYNGMGDIFYEMGNSDSTAYYYGKLEELVNQAESDKDIWFYFYTLAHQAKSRGDFEKAFDYYCRYDIGNNHSKIEEKRNNLVAMSQKYDTAVMQNELNENIIRKQRVIILISGIAALVLLASLISQIRLARNRKREAEINAELFHFKQQSQALAQKDAEHEQIQKDYADRLSEALDKEQQTMMLLDIYLNNSKKANLLNDLERSVFGDKDHWKAMLAVVEEKYPGLWETLGQKYPDLDEDEKKSFILSHFKVLRQEEADYLGTTVNMVDKLRGRVRKKMAERQ
jgi:tetratricopeptide (TPR) repeat protein